ncbi:hypothetical protein ACJX0J_040586 [Zea mays]
MDPTTHIRRYKCPCISRIWLDMDYWVSHLNMAHEIWDPHQKLLIPYVLGDNELAMVTSKFMRLRVRNELETALRELDLSLVLGCRVKSSLQHGIHAHFHHMQKLENNNILLDIWIIGLIINRLRIYAVVNNKILFTI